MQLPKQNFLLSTGDLVQKRMSCLHCQKSAASPSMLLFLLCVICPGLCALLFGLLVYAGFSGSSL